MMNAERVLEAVKASGAKKVALIDDAFDAPAFVEAHASSLVDFMQADNSAEVLMAAGIGEQLASSALKALLATQYDSHEISQCFGLLYQSYSKGRHDRFDPGGVFKVLMGDN